MGAGRDASLQQLLSRIAQSKPRVSDLSQVPLEIFIFFILCVWLFHHSWILEILVSETLELKPFQTLSPLDQIQTSAFQIQTMSE